jgi:DNA invertase Pin-like site-specific DNA recombinase
MNPDQITAAHRQRAAFVYIRQSSERQVLDHQESQRRQRNLVHRAVELGWHQDQVEQIDEDLGLSGSRSQARSGFDRLVAEAALRKVGIILALEASRFCRGNRDWYHLLDICAITKTLIGDGDGLYDPRDHNDRLLLGLKGTMSETELHVMKQRLVEATRERARRGELQIPLPAGLRWDPAGRIIKTPDEQVLSVRR